MQTLLKRTLVRASWLATLQIVVGTSVVAAKPGGFDLLEKVREAYRADEIRDFGQLSVENRDGEMIEWYFELTSIKRIDRSDSFVFRLRGGLEQSFREQVVWQEKNDSYHYDSARGQYRSVTSIASTLAHDLVDNGLEALAVPILAVGSPAPLAEPDAVAVDGPLPYDGFSCYLLTMSRMSGSIETTLWIDAQNFRVRKLEIELSRPDGTLGDRAERITVYHRPEPLEDRSSAVFAAPEKASLVTEWSVSGPQLESEFFEVITVEILPVVARIVDEHGVPLIDVQPTDLIAKVGKQELPISAIEWYGPADVGDRWPEGEKQHRHREDGDQKRLVAMSPLESRRTQQHRRDVLLFVQTDFERSRIKGHLKVLPLLRQFVESLGSDDRLALLTYTRHLELWIDFTTDRSEILDSLDLAVRPASVPPEASYSSQTQPRQRGALLSDRFDRRHARRIAAPEKAFEYVADILRGIPGEKELVYLGYGLTPEIGLSSDWWDIKPAVEALERAHTTVFVLDVSQADFHTLEFGMRTMARATGGTYASTFRYGEREVKRLAHTISGHFVVTVDRGAAPEAKGELSLELRQRKGRVLFSPRKLG